MKITELEVIRVAADELLVMRLPPDTPQEAIDEFSRAIVRQLPEFKDRLMIIYGDVEFSVVKK